MYITLKKHKNKFKLATLKSKNYQLQLIGKYFKNVDLMAVISFLFIVSHFKCCSRLVCRHILLIEDVEIRTCLQHFTETFYVMTKCRKSEALHSHGESRFVHRATCWRGKKIHCRWLQTTSEMNSLWLQKLTLFNLFSLLSCNASVSSTHTAP